MHRVTAYVLIIFGAFQALAGVLGGALLIGFMGQALSPSWDVPFLFGVAGVIMAIVVGLLLMTLGLRALPKAGALGQMEPSDGRVAGFLPGARESRQVDGRAVEVHYIPRMGKTPSSLTVRLAVPSPVAMHLDPEGWFDTLCKWAGLAHEHQTGDARFDNSVYVRCPSNGFAHLFLSNSDRRRAISALLASGFKQVRLTRTHVEAFWPAFTPGSDGSIELTDEAGRHLAVLSSNMPMSDPDRASERTDWGLIRAVVFWVALLAISATFLFAFVYPPVRVSELLFGSALAYVLALPAFGWLAAWQLRGASTSHDRWACLMAPSVILLALGSMGSVAGANALLDRSPVEARSPVIHKKEAIRGKKGSTSYRAYVADWRGSGQIELSITAQEHAGIFTNRSRMSLEIGNGALGIEWIKAKKVILSP
jgi:hypothetical protein